MLGLGRELVFRTGRVRHCKGHMLKQDVQCERCFVFYAICMHVNAYRRKIKDTNRNYVTLCLGGCNGSSEKAP